MRLLVSLIVMWSLSVTAGEIPRALVVRFNTVCASCHEGECSGRLSFQSGPDAARGHMERYLGTITDAEANANFALLRHTKEHCAHYPVAAELPADGVWTASDLSRWRNVREGGYFIPLGNVGAGSHRLQFRFAATVRSGRLKITDQHFEMLIEDALSPENTQEKRFITAGGPLYMTLQTDAELIGIRLDAAGF